MPEGPEIRRAALTLHRALSGHRLRHAYSSVGALQEGVAALIGQRVEAVCSRGKAMLTHFGNGQTLYSHNQLYGRWELLEEGDYPQTNRSLRLALHAGGRMALLYSASDIALLDAQGLEAHPYLRRLGPELLDERVDEARIRARFEAPRFQRRALFGLLQDQGFVSGMGNYLACEVLHRAAVHPQRRLADLSPEQRRALADASLRLTRQSLHTGGITNDPQRAERLQRQGADFESCRFLVYRREGLPCYRCGAPIEKGRYGGRMGYCCPACQR